MSYLDIGEANSRTVVATESFETLSIGPALDTSQMAAVNPYLTSGAAAIPNPNPLASAGYSGLPSPALSHNESMATPLRTQRINMVRETKALKLTVTEQFLKYFGGLFALPFLGLTCIRNIPTKTTQAIFRFGKLDRVITEPGLAFVLPFGETVSAFTGTQTHKINELNVVDLAGNPIIVRALLEFSVSIPYGLIYHKMCAGVLCESSRGLNRYSFKKSESTAEVLLSANGTLQASFRRVRN